MKRLGIVADTYVDFSIKDSTRKSRGIETRLKDTQSSTVYTLFTGCDPTSSFMEIKVTVVLKTCVLPKTRRYC